MKDPSQPRNGGGWRTVVLQKQETPKFSPTVRPSERRLTTADSPPVQRFFFPSDAPECVLTAVWASKWRSEKRNARRAAPAGVAKWAGLRPSRPTARDAALPA